jgi:lipid A 3-O-deacylase
VLIALACSSAALAQSAGDSAAGQAIALTPASTLVAMNPVMLGDTLRSSASYGFAHKPGWRTSGIDVNVGALRIQAGKGHFAPAPRESEYFVGVDFARRLLRAEPARNLAFVVGVDASLGYGAIEVEQGYGDVAETAGAFLSFALRWDVGPLAVIPYFAPGFFAGRYTLTSGSVSRAESGKRLTQGGGIRAELFDHLTVEFAVRKTRISGAVPRYGMAAGFNALPFPRGVPSNVNNLRVEMDNDYFAFWISPIHRPDEDYTNGVRVSFDRSVPVKALSRLSSNETPCALPHGLSRCAVARVEFGQEIYTPIGETYIYLHHDRPYAGWLYGSYAGHVQSQTEDRILAVTVGVVGPESFAESVQKGFHALFPGYRHPVGWETQLAFEPGVVASVSRRYLLATSTVSDENVQVIPEWKLSAGNVLTGASAKTTMRLGYRMAHPWDLSGAGHGALGGYVFGAIREDLVLHDIFLDGNTFRANRQVKRVPWVWQREWGGGLQLGFVTAEYRAAFRQREYSVKTFDELVVTQIGPTQVFSSERIPDVPKSHPYGTVAVTINRSF